MVSPVAAYVDALGAHAPSYDSILSYLQSQMQTIYGADIYLANDSQDGQMLGIFALAISDANSAFLDVYNNYSPQTAQGVGLSNAVQLNGMQRIVATNSTVDVLISGTPGTEIVNGNVKDTLNQTWNLPALVIIPSGTTITVSATAVSIGAVQAAPGTVTGIGTPTRGWNSVTNAAAAIPGVPVESDATLRQRQQVSTMIPSQTVLDGLQGAIATITDVTTVVIYENTTSSTDGNGIPSNSIACVVQGGDPVAIANTIFLKKSGGCGTYGTTSEVVIDRYGASNTINFYRPTGASIQVSITIKALTGYVSNIGVEIQNALLNYINSILTIGGVIYFTRLYIPATLPAPDGATYEIVSILIGKNGGGVSAANITLAFTEIPTAILADMTLTVT